MKTGPTVALVEQSVYTSFNDADQVEAAIESTTSIDVWSSPYYLDKSHAKLSVDLNNTQVTGTTAVLPLQQPEAGESDSLVLTAEAFTTLQNADLAVSAPIRNSEGEDFASWAFPAITDGTIETDLNLSDQLSDTAQGTVDKLSAADQAKIMQEVNLSHNGTLPGRATIRIKATEVPGGNVGDLFLYWVKEDGTIVPAEVVEVQYDAATQEYIITVDHCSEYVITSGKLESVSTPGDTEGGGTEGGGAGDAGSGSGTPALTSTPVPGQSQPAGTPDEPASGNTQDKLFSAQQAMDSFESQTGDVTLRLNGRTAVSQTAFALLMEREEGSLRLEGEGFAWAFDRADLADTQLPGGVFDAAVNCSLPQATMERIRSYTGDAPVAALDTAFSGRLPGKAVLEITVDAAIFGNTRCGLSYLPDAGDPERVATVEVDANGLVKLPLEHCSVYYLVVEEVLTTAPDADQQDPAPADPAPTQPEETAPAQGGSPAVPMALAGLCVAWRPVRLFGPHRHRLRPPAICRGACFSLQAAPARGIIKEKEKKGETP